MRALSHLTFVAVIGLLMTAAPSAGAAASSNAKNRQKCAGYGFEPGTDAFAKCVMKLSLRQERNRAPDHDTLVRQYRDRSMARRGDSRYPVCTAGMMDNELDISTGKWVGPNCQMAPD